MDVNLNLSLTEITKIADRICKPVGYTTSIDDAVDQRLRDVINPVDFRSQSDHARMPLIMQSSKRWGMQSIPSTFGVGL